MILVLLVQHDWPADRASGILLFSPVDTGSWVSDPYTNVRSSVASPPPSLHFRSFVLSVSCLHLEFLTVGSIVVASPC